MCSTCTTAFDMAATNAVVAGAFAINAWERTKDQLQGRTRLAREVTTWERNATFLRGIGLDPLSTLGAPPAIPTEDPEPVTAP